MADRGFDAFLQSFRVNLGLKIVSVAVAVVLWVVVLGSRNVEVTKDVPVEVITPGDLVPANELPDKVTFRLAGPKAFLRAMLDRKEDTIRINLSSAKAGLVTYRFFSDNIRIPIGVKVLSINPTAILVKLEPVKRRDVPVRVDLRGVPPEGIRITKTEVVPSHVRIRGAESRVEAVTDIATAPVDLSRVRASIDREVVVEASRYNVSVDGPMPRLLIEVEAANANFRIKNVDIRVLSHYKVNLNQKTVTVFVRANPGDLKSLDRQKVYAVVDLQGKPRGNYPAQAIRVNVPENIGYVKAVPEKVDVTLY